MLTNIQTDLVGHGVKHEGVPRHRPGQRIAEAALVVGAGATVHGLDVVHGHLVEPAAVLSFGARARKVATVDVQLPVPRQGRMDAAPALSIWHKYGSIEKGYSISCTPLMDILGVRSKYLSVGLQ